MTVLMDFDDGHVNVKCHSMSVGVSKDIPRNVYRAKQSLQDQGWQDEFQRDRGKSVYSSRF